MEQQVGRMDQLARERTLLANERTMLAHIRTAFASFLFGIAIIKLYEQYNWAFYLGAIAIIAGVIFLIIGLAYYPIRNKKIRRY